MGRTEEPERERGERIEALLDELESLPADEREAHLARVCPDAELRREVLALFTLEPGSAGYLKRFVETLAPKRLAPPDVAGKRIGPWRLLRPLGRGGMGVVYEAERADGAFPQRVALKLLATSLTGTEGHKRFLAERRILAGLEHPAIARIIDGGVTEDGTPWFAMDHVEGEPVDAYCDRRRFGIRERLKLFLQICEAVDHAHCRLVVHRDIKPANVLVTVTDPVGEPRVKLLDFGIAKLLEPEGASRMEPATRAWRLMTPEYASPEQVRGEAVTTASDVYQLGLLLYELLSGHRPYSLRHRHAGELERAISEQMPARPSTVVLREDTRKPSGGDIASSVEEICRVRRSSPARLRRRLRGDLDNIVLKALSKEPERRYRSADRLAQDIRRHLEGLPVTARSDTWGYRGRKFLERHAVSASAAVLTFVLAAGMVAFHMERIQGERDRAQTEATKAQQVSRFLAGLFRSSDPREAQGTEITVREALDRGAEQVERELAEQPEVQADMLYVLGRTYMELGHFDSAEPLLTRALALRRSRLGTKHLDVAVILGDLGLLRYRQGEYARARGLLENADQIFTTSPPGGDVLALAEVLGTLSQTYRRLGEYDRGLATAERALSIQKQAFGEDSAHLAAAHNAFGTLLFETGAYERAEAHFEHALAVHEQSLGPDHPSVSFALMNLAIARTAQNEREGVETMLRRALAIVQKAYGPVHPTVATALNNLGYFLAELGRNDEAIEVLEESVKVASTALGPEHPQVAYALDSLGEAYLAGGRLHAARSSYQRSVALREKAPGERHFDPVLANSLVGLGRSEAELGNKVAAEQILIRALNVWRHAPETVDPQIASSLLYLGQWLVERHRCAEAAPLMRRVLQSQPTDQSPSDSELTAQDGLLAGCMEEPLTTADGST